MAVSRLIGLILILALPQRAEAAELKTAVMPLTAKRVPEATVDILDDLLVNEVAAKSGSTVIGSQDINAILGLDKMKEALGCDDLACAVQIGGALGVDFLLTGSVSALGGEVIVSLTLIDTKESIAKKRAQSRAADDERFYAYAVAAAVAELYGLPAPAAPRHDSGIARRTEPADDAAGQREAARRVRDRLADAPASNAPAALRLRSGLAGARASVRSLADGEERACPEPLAADGQCYVQDLPAGPATVSFQLDDRTVSKEIVVRGGDLERQLRLADGRLGAMPYVIGAIFVVGGAALLYAGLNMDDTIGPDGQPTWGEGKMMAVIFGGSCIGSGLITPFIIVAQNDDYPIYDSAAPSQPAATAAATAPGDRVGLSIAPTTGGAAAVATWRF